MLSLRTLARSAPRVLSRATAGSLRQSAIARPSAFVKLTGPIALRPARAAFSTTVARRAADGESDDQLSAKLESEIQIEEDMRANEQQPASVKDFLASTSFELIDVPGQESVKLVGSFGSEKITVSFSIADFSNYDPYSEDAALGDEEDHADDGLDMSGAQGSARSAGNTRPAPADEQAEDGMDEDVDEEPTAAPINVSITVEKPGKALGALHIDATASDGNIVVDNASFYEDAKIAKADSPETAQKRADVYPGPPFGSLDEDLQTLLERFLEERGITQAMAVFIHDYVDVKEQAEYLRWLNNVRAFVDA